MTSIDGCLLCLDDNNTIQWNIERTNLLAIS